MKLQCMVLFVLTLQDDKQLAYLTCLFIELWVRLFKKFYIGIIAEVSDLNHGRMEQFLQNFGNFF